MQPPTQPLVSHGGTPVRWPVRLEDTLRSIRLWIPEDALLAAFPDHLPATVRDAVSASVAEGRVVRDARGWVRLNPVFRRRGPTAPEVQRCAQVALDHACLATPADLSLQVARLSVADWQDPGMIDSVEQLFERARWGLRARELVDMLDDADLLGTLIEVVPRGVLALLIEGGRTEQARPLVGRHDRYLRGLLAFQDGDLEAARASLDGVVGLSARFLRIEVHRAAFDYDAMEAELAAITTPQLAPMDALRRAFFQHRVVSYRGRWDQLPATVELMRAAAAQTGDGSLRCRVVDAELSQSIRMGDVPASVALLSELERLVGEGWSPGLQSRLTLYHAFVADLAGDHLRFEAALARPFSGRTDTVFRQLQEAALAVLKGNADIALACPAVRGVKGMEAQFLATVGRLEEALERVDTPLPGFGEIDHLILRAPIDARLGRGRIVDPWPGITPFQLCKLSLANTLVALAAGALDAARDWADRGLSTAAQRGLWNLGAALLLTRADVAARRGELDDARADLDRFDELGRHAHGYLTNQAAVARARLDDARPDDRFIERLVRQQDRISLGILAARWSLGPAADTLLAELPEVTCEQLEASFLTPRGLPTLTLRAEGRWVGLPDGTTVDLRRSGAPRRLLVALARARMEAPGQGVQADALVSIGWPGEAMHWESARSRLYTVVRRLRARGVVGLETVDGGYRISPEVGVCFDASTPDG